MLHIIIFILKIIGILLLVIFIGSLFVQRFFCRYFCPMGAIYSLISQTSFLKIDKPREECGKCHLCTSKCTMGMDLTKKDRIAGNTTIANGKFRITITNNTNRPNMAKVRPGCVIIII